ncbi:MAG: ATP citrate lyase citrate-binding domain-containing protein [Nanoarchaeota archaeon]|nr:ATP citrate lyase citrate-binding domain-containing protein [Nanoarchaeota archaeon]
MARKKIREYDTKRLIAQHFLNQKIEYKAVLVTPEISFEMLLSLHPWLLQEKLVVKPDMLFGKRKKLNLVLLHADFPAVRRFIEEQRSQAITIGKATGFLTHFLIEPFIPHDKEYFVAIRAERDYDTIFFSEQGGIDIEENWHAVKQLTVPVLSNPTTLSLTELTKEEKIQAFMRELYAFFVNLDFTYLELNPFTFDATGKISLLDAVAHLDSSAACKNEKLWNGLSFPPDFGKKAFPEEEAIAALDQQSGASLKLTLLNPQGRIWNILSGGGASIIYLDTLADRGEREEIANYGEYGGNPTEEESYQYARTILDLMTRTPHPDGKVLIIGGAIANFTDVEKTFTGMVRALREYAHLLLEGKVSIIVRRGGPNYEKGLQLMRQAGEELGISLQVYGPETPMIHCVPQAMHLLHRSA